MIEIIPAIDLIEGKCVRLSQGDFTQKKIYNENPLETAKKFENAGLKRVHIVDLDGAKTGKAVNLRTLEQISRNTNLSADFGGGIKTDEDINSVFDAGATAASIGSVAVKNADKFFEWTEKFGSEKILLGADVKNKKLAVNGWQLTTEIEILPFLREYFGKGIKRAFVTDIAKDGLLQGASTELYTEILQRIPQLKLIASGGVSGIEDVKKLEEIGCAGAIIGKAIYEGKIPLEKIAKYVG